MKPIEQIKRRLSLALKDFSTPRRVAIPELDDLEQQLGEINVPALSAWYAKVTTVRPKRRILPVSLLGAVSIRPTVSKVHVAYPPGSEAIPRRVERTEISGYAGEAVSVDTYADAVLSDELRTAKQEKRQTRDDKKNAQSFLSLVKRMKERLSNIGKADQSQSKATSLFYMGLISIVGIASIMAVGKVVSGVPSFSSIFRGLGWSKNVKISTETTSKRTDSPHTVSPSLTVKTEKTLPIEVEVTNTPTELTSSSVAKATDNVLSPLNGRLLEGAALAQQQHSMFREYLSKSSKLSAALPTAMVRGPFRNDLNNLQSAAQKLKTVPSTIESCCTVPPLLSRNQGTAAEPPQLKLPSLPLSSAPQPTSPRVPLKQTEQQSYATKTVTEPIAQTAQAEPPTESRQPQTVFETAVFNNSLVRQATRVITQPYAAAPMLRTDIRGPNAVSVQTHTEPAKVLRKDAPLQRLPTQTQDSPSEVVRKTVSTQSKVSLRTVPLVPYDNRLYESNLVRL